MDYSINGIIENMMSSMFLSMRSHLKYICYVQFATFVLKDGQFFLLVKRLRGEAGTSKNLGIGHRD